ncbi:dihydrolipoyl dehydrogenase [Anaeromassilibacillus senegalensis]|uniref:dihydrolipoyl dehydrogenase n=1 Tax=Anaeromassilibacillus senegalensis TaxID=1673717 RepID=UPI000B12AE69|nr:dihydrolipoyl dehydrogenase [Anaeromassilibacillus senegalensis]
MDQFDLIVIGAGPGGYVAALEAARLGKRVAIAEKREVGGTCLNRGCIPTKALLRAARVYREAKDSEKLGISVSGVSYNMEEMHGHVQEVTAQLRSGIELLLKKAKVTVLHGTAAIKSPNTVYVGEECCTAEHILVAAGSKPARPPIPGLDLPGVVTSDEMLEGGVDCKRLVIIGGGVIGVEFAQIYGTLGCEVTILEAAPRILPAMDREIAQNLAMIFKKRGVQVHANAFVQEIASVPSGLLCRYTEKEQAQEVQADCVLVCTGRVPNTQGLCADGLALCEERGYIPVDERYETRIPGIYAIGDVVQGGIQLAHAAEAEAKNAVHAMFAENKEKDLSAIPSCIFTEPEIAAVGLTADEAKATGRAVSVKKSLTSANGKAVIDGADRGFVKLVFDTESRALLGAQLMCPHASEMIGGLTTAVSAGLTEEAMMRSVYPHPTVSETILA